MLGWGFYILILEPYDNNCNISCHSKILSSCTFWLLKLTEVMSNQESVVTVNTCSYRHTENISLDFEQNRHYLMKIKRNSQIHGSFVY